MDEREQYMLYLTTGFSWMEAAISKSNDIKLHTIVADMKHSFKGLVDSYEKEIAQLKNEKAL